MVLYLNDEYDFFIIIIILIVLLNILNQKSIPKISDVAFWHLFNSFYYNYIQLIILLYLYLNTP